jgi:hypothetical protein
LQESVETIQIGEPIHRVTFERDEGQQYRIGARVAVYAMNAQFRTLVLDPVNGSYRVTRCERVSNVGWKALRISLHVVTSPGPAAALATMVADDCR